MLFLLDLKEEQVLKVKSSNNAKLQELGNQIQDKLVQAQNRKEHMEQEQLEKLRKNVSNIWLLFQADFLFDIFITNRTHHYTLCQF